MILLLYVINDLAWYYGNIPYAGGFYSLFWTKGKKKWK